MNQPFKKDAPFAEESEQEDLTLPENPKQFPAEDKAKKTSDTKMTSEIFNAIQSQNMGEGTFDATKVEDTEAEPDVDYKVSPKIEPLGKYSDEIIKDILSNPAKYKMKSPKHGEMNLKAALDKGYNPESDEFDRKPKKSKEEITAGLSESDKSSIDAITDPSAAKIPPKDAEALGVKDERFIAKDETAAIPEVPVAEPVPGAEDQAGLEALLGGGQ